MFGRTQNANHKGLYPLVPGGRVEQTDGARRTGCRLKKSLCGGTARWANGPVPGSNSSTHQGFDFVCLDWNVSHKVDVAALADDNVIFEPNTETFFRYVDAR